MLPEIVAKARDGRCKALDAVRSREPRGAVVRAVFRSSRASAGRAFARGHGGTVINIAFPRVA